MSTSINRFLSRRDKNRKSGHQEKVMSPPLLSPLPAPGSSSASSIFTLPGAVTPVHSSSSSISSLSLAFPNIKTKRSPRLQAVGLTILSSTANTCDCHLLQPRQTEGYLHGLFEDDEESMPVKSDEKTVKAITKRLLGLGIRNFKAPDIEYVLKTAYSDGDVEKAFDLLVLVEDSENFIVRDYDPQVKLLGAVNRHNVTCYLDATLFAIFARLDSFEAILYNTFDDEPRKRLSTLLRLWVNSLRMGKLITVDITKQLQGALASCGWVEAAEKSQQDASEAFSFITEKLELPMLTLKSDIFHAGKEDPNDDHKLLHERLLEVAIPEESTDGKILTLEECLENYFNNKIDVKRYLERRATMSPVRSRWSISSHKGHVSHIESIELEGSQPSTPVSLLSQTPEAPYSPLRQAVDKQRVPSIIQEKYISEKGDIPGLSLSKEEEAGSYGGRPRTGSIRKEVMMPAWQFFSLIPWYTDIKPKSDAQVAAHFSSKRPILGICLKRYSFLADGKPVRRGTYVDIPLEIALPHFIQDDGMNEDGPAFGNFKLSLQSVVCHRGDSVDSGHYVSLVRGAAPNASGGDAATQEEPEDRWMLFDDLAKERIRYVDIEKTLKKESPYLLFYQVQPIEGDPGNIEQGEKPPSYLSCLDSGVAGLSGSNKGSNNSMDDPRDAPRISFEEPKYSDLDQRTNMSDERRPSVAFTDSSHTNGTKDTLIMETHTDGYPSGNASLTVSRRPSRTGRGTSKSRRSSQNGENRLSASFSRLAGKLAKEKPEISVAAMDMEDLEESRKTDPLATLASTGPEAAKLKKDPKEKTRTKHSVQSHLTKARSKADKPDRECSVM